MVENNVLKVKKRNGRGFETLNIDKIHEMVEYMLVKIYQVFLHHRLK